MSTTARIERHSKLFNAMASRSGVDTEQALQEARVTPEDLAAAVMSCTGCLQAGPCVQHLASPGNDIMPGCRNSLLLAELADPA